MFHILAHRISIVLTLLMVCAFCYAPLSAQTLDSTKADSVQKARENWYWAHGSYTYALQSSDALSIGLSAVVKGTLLTVHLKQIFPSYDLGMTSGFNLTEIAGMYGWINQNDWSFSSVSLGVAYCFNNDYPTPKSGVGLVYEAQIALKAYVPGIGLKVCGNINTVQTYLIGGGIVFHLGWMP